MVPASRFYGLIGFWGVKNLRHGRSVEQSECWQYEHNNAGGGGGGYEKKVENEEKNKKKRKYEPSPINKEVGVSQTS